MRFNPTPNKFLQAIRNSRLRPMMVGALCGTTVVCATPALAQEAPVPESETQTEVIEVRGVRQTIQDAIAIKRESTEIVDGLSAADIGDLPALSIGEALETLTGASSHRDQGGATEISVRGLGPFLGSTVFNGREASNGGGDRSVNFSQFPSELFNKVAIAKTQSAEYIEGGVAGQIQLETVKPIDYGKRQFLANYKANLNPDNDDLEIQRRGIGGRLTLSYIDQYETDSLGEIGFSIGAQVDRRTNPEQEARTGTAFENCVVDPNTGIASARTDCDVNIDDADPDAPNFFTRSQNSFRQNITEDDRQSVFTAVQWRPTDKLEINLDYEYSDRDFSEVRNDLVLAEVNHVDGPFGTNPDAIPGGLILSGDSVVSSSALQNIETNSQFQERLEKYNGGGIEFIYDINDSLTVSSDFSISNTTRRENIFQTRLQSANNDISGNDIPGTTSNGEVQTRADVLVNGSIVPTITFRNFDVTDADLFSNAARTRLDINQARDNRITAFRTDFEYIPDIEYIRAFKAGVRFSKLEFESVPRERQEIEFSNDALSAASRECRNDVFPESGFFDNETGGVPLFTNIDSNGNVIEEGTGNSFATFDPRCLVDSLLASGTGIDSNDGDVPLGVTTFDEQFPTLTESSRQQIEAVDVEEKTTAVYFQADYDTFVGDYSIRGNVGLRVVHTDVESIGFRTALEVERDELGVITDIDEVDGSTPEQVVGGNSYTELLPSANITVDLTDDIVVRGGLYRALSRPDPDSLGFGRAFQGVNDELEATELSEVLNTFQASGNPDLEPFTSWNGDVAVEWYANDDTLLAVGAYYKSFEGGFENVAQTESIEVDGLATDVLVSTVQTTDETSTIFGLELTATHSFSYLDSWLNGFGVKLSYNYANSNFEFEDDEFGDNIQINDDGEEVFTEGIIGPANLFGFSRHVLFGQLYYQYEGFSASINYKYRSHYFQQFTNDPDVIRFIDDTEVWEARVSYRLNRSWKFSVEAINIFDEPRRQFRPTRDNFSEVNVYGPRLFAGVQYRY
ncbi:TonB-dependent receptor [Alteromonas sp. 5E99-2]|uniref:TonB-dependent receptor n=1 Tax=Alteromonas sp. 5E99-2 TaxID=2817683 RepID=UPI001A99293E|nr:TonB-dependent receptor [Alteromonas sp. 5E99-2]MBO1256571.1 TonB-dependent receptor [Alteromonas sp. 5E99-2]